MVTSNNAPSTYSIDYAICLESSRTLRAYDTLPSVIRWMRQPQPSRRTSGWGEDGATRNLAHRKCTLAKCTFHFAPSYESWLPSVVVKQRFFREGIEEKRERGASPTAACGVLTFKFMLWKTQPLSISTSPSLCTLHESHFLSSCQRKQQSFVLKSESATFKLDNLVNISCTTARKFNKLLSIINFFA